MKFTVPLVEGTLIKRYKRFLADITLENGKTITAHCPNTGSMKTCGDPGDKVILSYNPSPKRKLDYSWEFTKTKKGFIGINTMRPNQVIEDAIKSHKIKEFAEYDTVKREVKYGEGSRIDLLLSDSTNKLPNCYIEIKNATLKNKDHIAFPDAITKRGLKHLLELEKMVEKGNRAVLLFFVNRPDGDYVSTAKEIDPEYADQIEKSQEAGVEILAYRANSSLKEIKVGKKVPFVL